MSATTGDCLIANQFLCQEQCGKVLIQCLGVGIGVALGPLDEAAAVCNLGVIDFAANCVQAPSLSGQTTTTAASAGVANVPTSIASTAIPAAATSTPAACAGIVYTVKSGDVCSTIAATNGATTGDLVILNQDICGAANQNNLQVGAALCIVPGAAANAGPTIPADALNTAAYIKTQPCTGHVDIVMSGATCTAIATQFGITLAALKTATIPGQCDKLEAADAICVPGNKSQIAPTVSAPVRRFTAV
ncbi:hypothetical protein BDR26DRAFT_935168 [Obelidium mucronatum]|nr:hypothetical protein BDR26DRAFT_935168 [Obelidium mucronatum]